MSDQGGTFWGPIIMIFIAGIFASGVYVGKQYVPEPETIYVFESSQPMHHIFEKEISPYHEVKSYQTEIGERNYIVYYWVDPVTFGDGRVVNTLHWTWREVTGPQ